MNHLRITGEELARLCGVSQGTVDRALNDRPGINAATKEKILEIAKKYGWRPAVGNRKEEQHRHTIGIVAFDLNNEFFSQLIMDVEGIARSRGYFTMVLFTHYDPAAEIECLRQLYASGVDGIILCSVNHGEEFERFLKELSVPVVAVGNQTGNIPYVGIDDYKAMKEATEYLLASYQNIVYYSPAICYANAFAQKRRFEGFMAAMAHSCRYSIVTTPQEIRAEYSDDTAILCSTDYYALQAYAHCPGVKIMGFDNLRLLERLRLPIDSVDYDTAGIAREAFSLLVTGEKRDILIPHRVVSR